MCNDMHHTLNSTALGQQARRILPRLIDTMREYQMGCLETESRCVMTPRGAAEGADVTVH